MMKQFTLTGAISFEEFSIPGVLTYKEIWKTAYTRGFDGSLTPAQNYLLSVEVEFVGDSNSAKFNTESSLISAASLGSAPVRKRGTFNGKLLSVMEDGETRIPTDTFLGVLACDWVSASITFDPTSSKLELKGIIPTDVENPEVLKIYQLETNG